MNETVYKSEALEKGLDIIELLATHRGGLNKSEIANKLGKTTSQVFRTIAVLENRQYIASVTGLYFLTHKLNQLIVSESSITRLVESSRMAMATFSSETQQPCHLAVYNNGALVVVHQIDPPTLIGVNIRIGAVVDIATSGSGLCLMAFSNEENRERIHNEANLNSQFFEENANAIQRTQASGIVSEPSKDIVAVTNLSCPIYDENDELLAILTSPFLELYESSWQNSHIGLDKIKSQLKNAAKQVSSRLKL
ncbi:IclR family transcriptional regulator [Vibrio sinensis]|nr:helix-turn-helix domain-containing protein [Vibrio sinensis]